MYVCNVLVSVCLLGTWEQFKHPHYARKSQAVTRYNWHLNLSPRGYIESDSTAKVLFTCDTPFLICVLMDSHVFLIHKLTLGPKTSPTVTDVLS
jgi:hypothetical protein